MFSATISVLLRLAPSGPSHSRDCKRPSMYFFTFVQVLSTDLGQFSPNDYVVIFNLFLLFASGVFPGAVGSDAERTNVLATGRLLGLWISG